MLIFFKCNKILKFNCIFSLCSLTWKNFNSLNLKFFLYQIYPTQIKTFRNTKKEYEINHIQITHHQYTHNILTHQSQQEKKLSMSLLIGEERPSSHESLMYHQFERWIVEVDWISNLIIYNLKRSSTTSEISVKGTCVYARMVGRIKSFTRYFSFSTQFIINASSGGKKESFFVAFYIFAAVSISLSTTLRHDCMIITEERVFTQLNYTILIMAWCERVCKNRLSTLVWCSR